MVNSPCKDCQDRTKPKSCESSCLKWQKYVLEKEKEKEIIKQNKFRY